MFLGSVVDFPVLLLSLVERLQALCFIMDTLPFEDAVRALLGAGSRADRSHVPDLSAHGTSAEGDAVLDEVLASFPSLRLDVWSSISTGLDSAIVSGKHARRAGGEITYGLEVASVLLAQKSLESQPALLRHVGEWAWCISALIAQLCGASSPSSAPNSNSNASNSSAATVVQPRLPRLLQPAGSLLSEGWEGPDDDEPSGGVRSGVAAKVLSRVEDVGPLAGAAMRCLANAAPGSLAALRAGSPGGACPITAVATAALLALCGLVSRHSNPRKVFGLLLSLEGAGRPVAAPGRGSGGAASAGMDVEDGAGGSAPAATVPTVAFRDSLLSLALCVRDGAVASLNSLSAPTTSSAGGSAVLASQLSSLASACETLIEAVLFAPTDIALGYGNACGGAVALAQQATLAYAAQERMDASESGAAVESVDAAASTAPPSKKKAKHGAAAAAGASASTPLFVPPRLNGERKLFEEMRRVTSSAAASSAIVSPSAQRTEEALRGLPMLLASYLRSARRAREEAAAQGALDVTAGLQGQKPDEPAASGKRRRDDGASAIAAEATQAVASLTRSAPFAVLAELLAVATGFDASAPFALSPSDPAGCLAFPAPDAAQPTMLVSRIRAVTALLAVSLAAGLYSVNEDSAPHPQTATLWAVARWGLRSAQAALAAPRTDPAHTAAVVRSTCGLFATLLEVNHTLAAPHLPALLGALAGAGALISESGGSSDSDFDVVSGLALLVCQMTSVSAQLRSLTPHLQLLGSLLLPAPSSSSAGASALLGRVLAHPAVTAGLVAAFRDLPIGQVQEVSAAVVALAVEASERARAAGGRKAPEAAAGGKKRKSMAAAAVVNADDAPVSAASAVAHAVTGLACVFARELSVTAPSALQHVHTAVALAQGCAPALLQAAQAAGASPADSESLCTSACGILSASCDVLVRCAPYEAVRRHQASLVGSGLAPAPGRVGQVACVSDPLWPASAYIAAAEAVGPLPGASAPAAASSAKPLSGLAAMLSGAYSAAAVAPQAPAASAAADAGSEVASGPLPTALELCQATLSASSSPAGAAAGASLAESRLRLLHACLSDPSIRASDGAVSSMRGAAKALASMLLSPPAVVAGVAAGTVDVCAAWADESELQAFAASVVAASLTPASSEAASCAPHPLLCDAQLYELPRVAGHIAPAVGAALRAALAQLAASAGGAAAGSAPSSAASMPPQSTKKAAKKKDTPAVGSDDAGSSVAAALQRWLASGDASALAELEAAASKPAAGTTLSASAAAALRSLVAALSLAAALPRAVLVSHAYRSSSQGAAAVVDTSAGPALHASAPQVGSLALVAALCASALGGATAATASESLVRVASELVGFPACASLFVPRLEALTSAGHHGAAAVLRRAYVATAESAAASAPSSKKTAAAAQPAWLEQAATEASVTAARGRALAELAASAGSGAGDAYGPAVDALLSRALQQAKDSEGTAAAAQLGELAGMAARLASVRLAAKATSASEVGAAVSRAVAALSAQLGDSAHAGSAVAGARSLIVDVAAALDAARGPPTAASESYRKLAARLATPALLSLPLAIPRFFSPAGGDELGSGALGAFSRLLSHARLRDVGRWGAGLAAALQRAAAGEAPGPLDGAGGPAALPANALAAATALLQAGAQAQEDGAIAAAAATASAALANGGSSATSAAAASAISPSSLVWEGGYGLRDAACALVRSLLPSCVPLVASSSGASVALAAPALALLRSALSLPRLLPLRTVEVFFALSALTCASGEAACPPVRAARLALASRSHVSLASGGHAESLDREVRSLAVDVGRGDSDPRVIVTCAAAAFPQPGSAHAASAHQSSHEPAAAGGLSQQSLRLGSPELAGCAWALHALCRYRPDAALSAAPLVTQHLQALLVLALTPLPRAPGRDEAGYATAAALGAISRACEAYARLLKVARYHAGAVVGAYVQLATAGRGVASASSDGDAAGGVGTGLPLSIRSHIEPGIMALVDVLDAGGSPKELQQVYTQLSHAPLARGALKQLHRAYEAQVKYTGKA